MAKKRSGSAPDRGTAGRRADALYEAPFEEFTKRRNELAKELRKAGDRVAADEVATMRKPTRAAWAVNQLARRDRKVVRKVLDAGERLRKAQEEALGGGSGAALREAGAKEREAVSAAVERAAEVLSDQAGKATLERVRSSLQAAARDEGVRADVEAGRLTADHEPVGLGSLGSTATPPRRPRPHARETGPSAAARRRLRDAQVAARESNRRLEASRRELDRRRDAADRARQRLEAAQADARAAAAEAAQADADLERAEAGLDV